MWKRNVSICKLDNRSHSVSAVCCQIGAKNVVASSVVCVNGCRVIDKQIEIRKRVRKLELCAFDALMRPLLRMACGRRTRSDAKIISWSRWCSLAYTFEHVESFFVSPWWALSIECQSSQYHISEKGMIKTNEKNCFQFVHAILLGSLCHCGFIHNYAIYSFIVSQFDLSKLNHYASKPFRLKSHVHCPESHEKRTHSGTVNS